MTNDLMHLKSGTDIRGVAVAEGGKTAVLTEAIGVTVGKAFADFLAADRGKPCEALTVAVGRDSRVSGEALSAAIRRGLCAKGVTVIDCGLCTTPAMFMSTRLGPRGDGAVMVTASHLPWQRNGYKFFTPEGGLTGKDIEQILKRAAQMNAETPDRPDSRRFDLTGRYAAFLEEKVRAALSGEKPLQGLRVVVDAGNGAGGFYADFLSRLGADTRGSQYLEPDGRFPNHIPNPEDAGAMQALSEAVKRSGASLGVIFDADCDRMALADGDGSPINRNRLIALISSVLLAETPGATIVTDSVTSAGLDAFLSAHGGTLHRFKRGYHNVIDEARRLNAAGTDCPLAIETSGHAALRENFFLDDGMYLATRLLIEAARLSRRGEALCGPIASLQEPAESREIRLPIHAADFAAAGRAALDRLAEAVSAIPGWAVDPKNREGVRVSCDGDGNWFLLRLSVHDPLLVLNAESDRPGGVAGMLAPLKAILTGCEGIGEMPFTD